MTTLTERAASILAAQIRGYGTWQGPDAQLDELVRRAEKYDEMKEIVNRLVVRFLDTKEGTPL